MKNVMKAVSLVLCVSGVTNLAQAGNFKARLLECQQRKINEEGLNRTEGFSARGSVVCYSGMVVNFVDCRRDNKDQTIGYTAPDGFEIVGGVNFQDISSTDRGSHDSLSNDKRSASVKIHCRGNACDTGAREWMDGAISGVIKRVPTQEEISRIQNECLDEMGL